MKFQTQTFETDRCRSCSKEHMWCCMSSELWSDVCIYVCMSICLDTYIYIDMWVYILSWVYMTWTGTVVKSHLEPTTHWIMPCPAICVTPYNWLSDWQVIQILILLLLIWSTAHCPLAWSGGGRRCECCSAYGGWSWSWATEDRDRDSGDSLYWL